MGTIAQHLREEGRQLGRQEGQQQGWWEAVEAIRLLQSGVPIQKIVRLINMPTDIVAKLVQEDVT